MQKVLIIDDEKPTLTMFRLFLGAYGYEVFVAEDGHTGLDIVEKENPAIVFTDIKMPEMDGIEVLKRIKQLAPRTEVIVITGHGDMDLVIRALNLDATDFINKPVQRKALDAALKRAEARIHSPGSGESATPELERRGDAAVIHIGGRLDGEGRRRLKRVWAEAGSTETGSVILQFDAATSISGAGLTLVMQLLGEMKKHGKTTAICGLSENFKAIFDMLGITRSMDLFETVEEAIANTGSQKGT